MEVKRVQTEYSESKGETAAGRLLDSVANNNKGFAEPHRNDGALHQLPDVRVVATLEESLRRQFEKTPKRWRMASSCFLLSIVVHGGFGYWYWYSPEPALPKRQAAAQVMNIEFTQASVAPPPAPPVEVRPADSEPEKPAEAPDPEKVPLVEDPEASAKKVEPVKPKPQQKVTPPTPEKPLPPQKAAPSPSPKPAPPSRTLSPSPALTDSPRPSVAAAAKSEAPVIRKDVPGDRSLVENWEGQVLARLESEKRYPQAAIRRGQEDVIYVQLKLNRNGDILSFNIVKSKGIALLDKAVQDMVKRASPLPALPDAIKGDPYTVTIPVNFFLSRT